ncbi:MAG: VWA domain-containing protein, partial [Flavobacteriaceae bacterium]|nr:VWA domain-containing protein [Flavobacteriaceae bacterium]
KQQAEKIYTTAIRNGKRAAKLDQTRPNVFQMKVGNILPGDEITIDIYYTEMLLPSNGEYQFVAPGVVGPRFTGEQTSNDTSFNNPHTKKGISDTFLFDLELSLNTGITIQNIHSASHKINVDYSSDTNATVFLSKSNHNPANRDFILNFSLRGNKIETGLLLYEHDDEKFFAYLMEPTKEAKPKQINPREYLFIVDVSGSMNGYPLEVSKKLMRNLLCNLEPTDTFNVLLFASSSTTLSPIPILANGANIERGVQFLTHGQGGGGTQLLSALRKAYQLPRINEGSARSMIIITDGYVSVEKEAFTLISENLDKANVFTFGIGSSVNRYLIEGMASVSNSASFIATSKDDAKKAAVAFKEYISKPLLTQVKLKAKGFEIYDVQPASIPDVFSTRPVVVYGKYRGEAKGKLVLTGYQGKKKIKQEFKVSKAQLNPNNKALRYFWARKKIEQLDDYAVLFHEDVKERVIDLGLQYNLATQYTSFVAVDQQKVNNDGSLKRIKQPLPMPKNVESSAVGATGDITEKFKFKKSFTIAVFNGAELTPSSGMAFDNLSKTEERQIKMWFKAEFKKLIETQLLLHTKLRVRFGLNGIVLSIESFENGQWVRQPKITKIFQNKAVKKLTSKRQFTVVVTI